MSKRYEPQNIEKKWQKIWQDEKAFAATDDYTKPKYYALVEFPYPRRPSASVHRTGYRSQKAQNAGLQRTVSDGMGCIWSSD